MGRKIRFKRYWIGNKYLLTGLSFAVYMLFFDTNRLTGLYELRDRQQALNKDERWYKEKIQEVKRKLHELNSNEDQLEKFAREAYRMKRPEEEVFVFVARETLE